MVKWDRINFFCERQRGSQAEVLWGVTQAGWHQSGAQDADRGWLMKEAGPGGVLEVENSVGAET